MAERDYSDVTFPWDDDPNWGAPREGATSDPSDGENWRLACAECALYFPEDHLNLVWVGLGVPPKAR